MHTREAEVFHVQEGQVEFEVDGGVKVSHSFNVVGHGPARVLLPIFPAGIEGMFHELAQPPPGPRSLPE